MASDAISYDCFDDLIASLRFDGLSAEADRLHVLLHEVAWTTGSELLGELGQELKKIEEGGTAKPSGETREKIAECFRMVLRVWPDFHR